MLADGADHGTTGAVTAVARRCALELIGAGARKLVLAACGTVSPRNASLHASDKPTVGKVIIEN